MKERKENRLPLVTLKGVNDTVYNITYHVNETFPFSLFRFLNFPPTRSLNVLIQI